MNNTLGYLEGTRSIFCFVVVIHHYMLAFFPDVGRILINDGNISVMFFFILSGFVITKSRIDKVELYGLDQSLITLGVKYLVKRYFRLLPVVFSSILFAWLIWVNNGYFTQDVALKFDLRYIIQYYIPTNDISFSSAFYDAVWGSFINRPVLNTPLWTIKYEFFGGVIICLLSTFLISSRNRTIYAIICFMFSLLFVDVYFASLMMGMIFADLKYNKNNNVIHNQKVKFIIKRICEQQLALLLFLVSYVLSCIGIAVVLFKILSLTFLFLCILYNNKIQNKLTSKLLLKISCYTFEIYAIHWPIICSFSSWFMFHFSDSKYYCSYSIVCFCASCIMILLISLLIKMFEKNINNIKIFGGM